MTVYASLLAFIAAASLMTIAPGLDTALVLRTIATLGPRLAALAGLGVAVGCFGWAILVALALGASATSTPWDGSIAAWQVWDLGRLMAGHKPADLLDQVDAMEADMVSTEPAYF
jgi:hypothetical protein